MDTFRRLYHAEDTPLGPTVDMSSVGKNYCAEASVQINSMMLIYIMDKMKISNLSKYYSGILKACYIAEIDSVERISALIATIAVESGQLSTTEENLSYKKDRLKIVFEKKYMEKINGQLHPIMIDTTQKLDVNGNVMRDASGMVLYNREELAAIHAGRPELIANHVYAGVDGNGSAVSGDGYRYRGRGLIQITRKNNYRSMARAVGFGDDDAALKKAEKYLESDFGAGESVGYYWRENRLNAVLKEFGFLGLSRKINIGRVHTDKMPHGWGERSSLFARGLSIIPAIIDRPQYILEPTFDGFGLVIG